METAAKAQQELERIEKQIQQLEAVAGENQDARKRIAALHEQVNALRQQVSAYLGAWQKTELARHPQRPYTLDFIEHLFTDFSEIHGDRSFGDDPAMIVGMAKFDGEEVLVVGTQKGRDTKQKIYRNFGMPNPEGYRKAIRAMKLAEKFGRPIITLVDTPGAYPGLGAEERGQAEAIAYNIREMARLTVPVITVVTGEGGSGGALAIAIGNRVLMMENAIYSVISPEGCASIMWRDSKKKEEAAEALKITAKDLTQLKLIDGVIPEPAGGAHEDHESAAHFVADALRWHLAELKKLSPKELEADRYERYRRTTDFFNVE
jgi:acetyl-CoA carboxylase carboxyl transferase subunit alpha